jgi:hypothetical protein
MENPRDYLNRVAFAVFFCLPPEKIAMSDDWNAGAETQAEA